MDSTKIAQDIYGHDEPYWQGGNDDDDALFWREDVFAEEWITGGEEYCTAEELKKMIDAEYVDGAEFANEISDSPLVDVDEFLKSIPDSIRIRFKI